MALLDLFLDAGGDESKIMKRAVLLNARTGETVELRATLRALTGVVLTLVDQKIRARVSVSDEAFLENAKDAGAAIHAAAATHAEGEGFVPTPAAFADESKNATFDPPKEKEKAARGRGIVSRKPKPAPAETKTKKKSPRALSPKSSDTKPDAAGAADEEEKKRASSSSSSTIIVGGVARACDAKRRVLTGGNLPRPRGRAPKGAPYWDSVNGAFAAADEET
jgi:hypothetical protein